MTSRSISLSFPDFHFAHTGSRGGGGEQNSVSLKFYSFDWVGIKGEKSSCCRNIDNLRLAVVTVIMHFSVKLKIYGTSSITSVSRLRLW